MFCAAKAHPHYISFFWGGGHVLCIVSELHALDGNRARGKPGKREMLVGDGLLTQ
jgi:hypothetical protein